MKPAHPTHPIKFSPEVIAKCDAPDQFERFDRMFRSVIAVPKAEIEKREAKWKRARARKKPAKKTS